MIPSSFNLQTCKVKDYNSAIAIAGPGPKLGETQSTTPLPLASSQPPVAPSTTDPSTEGIKRTERAEETEATYPEHPQSKRTTTEKPTKGKKTTEGSKTVGDTVAEGNNHQGRMRALSYATVGLGLTIFWFFN